MARPKQSKLSREDLSKILDAVWKIAIPKIAITLQLVYAQQMSFKQPCKIDDIGTAKVVKRGKKFIMELELTPQMANLVTGECLPSVELFKRLFG